HAPEKIESHQGRFAALPRKTHDRRLMGIDELPDVGIHDLIRHLEAALRIQLFLVEIEAVFAVEVADGAGRLRHQMVGVRSVSCWHQVSGGRHPRNGTPAHRLTMPRLLRARRVGEHRGRLEEDWSLPYGRMSCWISSIVIGQPGGKLFISCMLSVSL